MYLTRHLTVSCNPSGEAQVMLSSEADEGKYQFFQATVMRLLLSDAPVVRGRLEVTWHYPP